MSYKFAFSLKKSLKLLPADNNHSLPRLCEAFWIYLAAYMWSVADNNYPNRVKPSQFSQYASDTSLISTVCDVTAEQISAWFFFKCNGGNNVVMDWRQIGK